MNTIDLVNPTNVEIEFSADGKKVYVHVDGITMFRASNIDTLTVNEQGSSISRTGGMPWKLVV